MTPWTVALQIPLSMGILQARILEWVAVPSSRGSSQPRDRTPGLLHCKWILYHLSHQESPYIFIHTHTHTHTCIYTHATIFKMEPAHMHKGRYWSSTKNSARRGPTLIPMVTLVIITAIISKESSVSQAL